VKTAVSIPDQVLRQADRLARRLKESRSQLFSNAVAEYVARHTPGPVTQALDELCDELGSQPDAFVTEASRRVLERTEW
jgi:predicted transcriptional regulator